jgi:hypothetical protein
MIVDGYGLLMTKIIALHSAQWSGAGGKGQTPLVE